MHDDHLSFFISSEEAGERLDKVLAKRFSEAGSRTYFQFLIDEGKVLLNGLPVKKRIKPVVDDEVEVEYILTEELTLTAENIPLNIVYEDSDLIVINKPAGMVVHPAPGHWSGTFVNALLFHCRDTFTAQVPDLPPNQALRPGIVHRLDKDTSGLLMAAKTPLAQQRLIEMFSGRNVYKEYLAICIGNPGGGTIDVPIGRHPKHRQMMAVRSEGGRAAITHFRTLAFDGQLSLVKAVIATGRTHQIRVHMRHRGTPVLGDMLYGVDAQNTKHGAKRQLLHAYRLQFNHPITGKPLEFIAEPPEDNQHHFKTYFAEQKTSSSA